MIVGYDFMMETDSGVLPAQASMTLYQDDQLSWLSSPEHHVQCQWIHPERNQLEVAALGTEPTGPANKEYGVMPEVASRVVADLGASDLATDRLLCVPSCVCTALCVYRLVCGPPSVCTALLVAPSIT